VALGLVIVAVLGLLAMMRFAAVSRQISRNNERMRLRDEDLALWVSDYDAELEGAGEMAHQDALELYGVQLKDAHRTMRAVMASERAAHHVVRIITGRPMPALEAPSQLRPVISRWEEPAAPGVQRAA